MASPTFVGIGTATSLNTSGGAVAVPVPAGVSEGDLLVLFIEQNNSTGEPDPPAEFASNLICEFDLSSVFASSYHAYWKIAGASEPASYSVNLTTQVAGAAVIAAWTGNDTTAPIDVSGTQQNSTSSTNVGCPSLTTTVADTTLVHFYGEYATSFPTATFTPDAAMTERLDTKLTSRPPFSFADEAIASAGATGTRTAVASVSMKSAVLSFAIAPSGASGAFTLTAGNGSFTETGQTVTLKAARKLAATNGSFTLSGQDVTLTGPGSKTLTAGAGSFTLTGQAVNFEVAVPASVASYTLSGQAATLTRGRLLAASRGSFALTGQDVTLISTAPPRQVSIMSTTQLPPPVNQVWVSIPRDDRP